MAEIKKTEDKHFNAGLSNNAVKNPTLQPAFPRAKATALPIPLEAPVITITGASTFGSASVLACSTVATCAFTPACKIQSHNYISTEITTELLKSCKNHYFLKHDQTINTIASPDRHYPTTSITKAKVRNLKYLIFFTQKLL